MTIIVGVALYLAILGLVYTFQRHLMYMPDAAPPDAMALERAGFEVAGIGPGQASLWRPPSEATAPVFLHFHGNAGSAGGRIELYDELAVGGAGALAVGYPGYGGNAGAPGETAFRAAARANYDWLIERGVPSARIVIVGQSIGSGPATWLASEVAAAGLILEAPFSAADDIAVGQFPFLPVRFLMKDRYRNIDAIAAIDMPLLWIHGDDDRVIPMASGRRLFDAAREPKAAHIMAGGGHNDLWQRGIGELIRAAGARFVVPDQSPFS